MFDITHFKREAGLQVNQIAYFTFFVRYHSGFFTENIRKHFVRFPSFPPSNFVCKLLPYVESACVCAPACGCGVSALLATQWLLRCELWVFHVCLTFLRQWAFWTWAIGVESSLLWRNIHLHRGGLLWQRIRPAPVSRTRTAHHTGCGEDVLDDVLNTITEDTEKTGARCDSSDVF